MIIDRRTFLATLPLATTVLGFAAEARDDRRRGRDLVGQFGITTGSFIRHLSAEPAAGKLVLLDLPKIMRDELNMTVIDLMTRCLPATDPAYCERMRRAAEDAKCVITNLKMNHDGLDLGSPDDALRKKSLEIFKRTIDVAALLGCRWVRPAPSNHKPDLGRLVTGLLELSDYAAEKKISLLVENNGWIKNDPDALPAIVDQSKGEIAVQPDTGNWTADARYRGLERAFPHAVTCDFKAFRLGPKGEHADYDLRRCFDIAWQAGFRGPWCFEHFHDNLATLFREMIQLREMLTKWTKEAKA